MCVDGGKDEQVCPVETQKFEINSQIKKKRNVEKFRQLTSLKSVSQLQPFHIQFNSIQFITNPLVTHGTFYNGNEHTHRV